MDLDFAVSNIALQPTSLCNLNCHYCYLPHRAMNLRMDATVPARVAEELVKLDKPVNVIWHGGEPLACGHTLFSQLVAPLDQLERDGIVNHVVQTNATLIDERWCEFFISHKFHIGVSLDGPVWANLHRVDWNGRETFDRALRGIECLQKSGIQFSAIAVITDDTLAKAQEIYEFFCSIGCSSLGINLEEREGANQRWVCDDERVTNFWRGLFDVWKRDPKIEIREFTSVLSWMDEVCRKREGRAKHLITDLFPTVGFNGDVVLLSPELLGTKCGTYHDFVVGNVCEESLLAIVARHLTAAYVQDFVTGVQRCEQECRYFSFCRGGQASNKFFELSSTNGTETVFCRNSQQRLVESVLSSI